MHDNLLRMRTIGFIASLVLTLAAYFIILRPELFPYNNLAILTLACLQGGVQYLFFLSLGKEKGIPWNLIVFLSTLGIIFIIVFFSIWIMHHLDYNMMP